MIGDSLYLWGGDSDDLPHVHDSEEKRRITSYVQIFDIITGKWNNQSTRGSPPLGVDGYFCTTVDDKIYYFGGYCGHGECFHNSLHELNISTFTWTQLQPTDDRIAVMKRSSGGMISTKGVGRRYLLLIGGQGCPPSRKLKQAQYYHLPNPSRVLNKEAGQHCHLLVGGIIPQAQQYQLSNNRVSTNEHHLYDLATGNNINISYYIIRYHLLQSILLHVIIISFRTLRYNVSYFYIKVHSYQILIGCVLY